MITIVFVCLRYMKSLFIWPVVDYYGSQFVQHALQLSFHDHCAVQVQSTRGQYVTVMFY